MTNESMNCAGFCKQCQTDHTLPMGKAKNAARELIRSLDRHQRIDFHVPAESADPAFSTSYLYGEARGKMFGVLVCQRTDGSLTTVKSFSGQYNGQWHIQGWAPPLFDLVQWRRVNGPAEKNIKKMGTTIETLDPNSPQRVELTRQRASKSRDLMKALHNLYRLNNFRGRCRSLTDAYTGNNGIPNGTADCCGPKLLNYAAQNNLRPVGIAEFYYGRENKQGNRIHGRFYSACRDKCAPILGYLLCGL